MVLHPTRAKSIHPETTNSDVVFPLNEIKTSTGSLLDAFVGTRGILTSLNCLEGLVRSLASNGCGMVCKQ